MRHLRERQNAERIATSLAIVGHPFVSGQCTANGGGLVGPTWIVPQGRRYVRTQESGGGEMCQLWRTLIVVSSGTNGGTYDRGISRSSTCGVMLPRGACCLPSFCDVFSLIAHPNPTHVAVRSNTTPPTTHGFKY